MPHPLDGAWEKVNRTHGQFQTLEAEIKAFCESRPYRMTFDPDIETGDQVVRVELDPLPSAIKWGVQIGEIVHNLRSALEHVVWKAVEANGNVPTRATGFPLFVNESDFRAAGRSGGQRMINGVSDDVRALIERLQPFHAREKGEEPEAHILYVLNELWNTDKHRVLHLCSTIADVSVSDVRAEGRVQIENLVIREPGRVERAAEIARYRLVHDLPIRGSVKVDAEITYDVALDEAGPLVTRGQSVRKAIPVLGTYVAAVLREFNPLLKGSP